MENQPTLFRTFRLPHPPSAVETKQRPVTLREHEQAVAHLRRQGGCYHDPKHKTYGTCLEEVIRALRGA